jgi:hypothetical protein
VASAEDLVLALYDDRRSAFVLSAQCGIEEEVKSLR